MGALLWECIGRALLVFHVGPHSSAVITAQSIDPVAHSTHRDGPEMNYLSAQHYLFN